MNKKKFLKTYEDFNHNLMPNTAEIKRKIDALVEESESVDLNYADRDDDLLTNVLKRIDKQIGNEMSKFFRGFGLKKVAYNIENIWKKGAEEEFSMTDPFTYVIFTDKMDIIEEEANKHGIKLLPHSGSSISSQVWPGYPNRYTVTYNPFWDI